METHWKSIRNCISHVFRVMILSYWNSNSSHSVRYFTPSVLRKEPDKTRTESQFPLRLHFWCLAKTPASQCWGWEYNIERACIWKWLKSGRHSMFVSTKTQTLIHHLHFHLNYITVYSTNRKRNYKYSSRLLLKFAHKTLPSERRMQTNRLNSINYNYLTRSSVLGSFLLFFWPFFSPQTGMIPASLWSFDVIYLI